MNKNYKIKTLFVSLEIPILKNWCNPVWLKFFVHHTLISILCNTSICLICGEVYHLLLWSSCATKKDVFTSWNWKTYLPYLIRARMLSMTLKRQVQQPRITECAKFLLLCPNTPGIRLSNTHQTTNSLIARPLSAKSVLGQVISPTLTIYVAQQT